MAISVGPNNPSAAANVAIGGSEESWQDVTDVFANNSTLASTTGAIDNSQYTDYIKTTGYGFSIPITAIPTSILVEVEISQSPGNGAKDNRFRLVRADSIQSTDALNVSVYTTAGDPTTYFSHTFSMAGTGWTGADINSSTFGVALSSINEDVATSFIFIDHFRITVTYELPDINLGVIL